MRPDPRAYLWDALRAAELVSDFTDSRTFADYQADAMLRSAVERQFEIVGEAKSMRSARAMGVAVEQLSRLRHHVPITTTRSTTGIVELS